MNFFKSIISDDPDPHKPESSHESGSNSPIKPSEEDHSPNDVVEDGGGWSFGGLIKTLATRSESVIETYSRDLKEFGSGLRKESEIIKDVASRAVKELPASLEAGTSAAHGVLKSTAEIIAKEVQVFASDGEPETPETNPSLNSGRYSRFDAQLSGIQSDVNTFCEEPEDVEEFKEWKSSFKLVDKKDEIDDLVGENGSLEGVYKKVVPDAVDDETFWYRYFYRVDKLKLQEKVRANLVKRAISADEDDDELSWDVDDDDEVEVEKKGEIKTIEKLKGGDEGEGIEIGDNLNDGSHHKKEEYANLDDEVKSNPVQSSEENGQGDEKEVKSNEVKSKEKMESEENTSVNEVKSNEVKSEEKMKSEENTSVNVGVVDNGAMKTEEEDLGWDEIEDIGSDEDDKKISRPNRAELRKQLMVAEDDEDLSWDIEDDDEPVKY